MARTTTPIVNAIYDLRSLEGFPAFPTCSERRLNTPRARRTPSESGAPRAINSSPRERRARRTGQCRAVVERG